MDISNIRIRVGKGRCSQTNEQITILYLVTTQGHTECYGAKYMRNILKIINPAALLHDWSFNVDEQTWFKWVIANEKENAYRMSVTYNKNDDKFYIGLSKNGPLSFLGDLPGYGNKAAAQEAVIETLKRYFEKEKLTYVFPA